MTSSDSEQDSYVLKRRNSFTQFESDFSIYFLENGVILYLHHGDIYHGQVESFKALGGYESG